MSTQHTPTPWRVAHIVEWNRCGQSCIALLHGMEVIARFSNWRAATLAYRAALAAAEGK